MLIQIAENKLSFVALPDEQQRNVIKQADKLHDLQIKDGTKMLEISGNPAQLFALVHKLSYNYDIEIV